MRCTTSCSTTAPPAMLEEGDLSHTLRKGGSVIPQATSTADLPAETVALAVPGPQRGAEAGPQGGTTMATAGFSTPRATTPRAAGEGSRAGLRTLLLTLLVMRAELQCPPTGSPGLLREERAPSAGRPSVLQGMAGDKEPILVEVPQHLAPNTEGAAKEKGSRRGASSKP